VRQLPTGTVTLFFTDIEGSTQLLHDLGDGYADVLADHRRALREAFERYEGVEVDTQGDAFFVAFSHATNAVAAARDGQRALANGPIRVRVGIHTGEPIVTREGYVGLDVHKAARIMGAGHGGQVLISEATRQLLDSTEELRDLGDHRLKDLGAPQRLYQLGSTQFPPLKTLHQTNLPIQATPLVGRERELVEAGDLLRSSRLLTLTGPGGSGKTRLALQLAAEAQEELPDGVFWVSLEAVRDPAVVERAIATRSVRTESSRSGSTRNVSSSCLTISSRSSRRHRSCRRSSKRRQTRESWSRAASRSTSIRNSATQSNRCRSLMRSRSSWSARRLSTPGSHRLRR
jgi:hypothetical protein